MSAYCDTTRSPCNHLIEEAGYGIVIHQNRWFMKTWTKGDLVKTFAASEPLIRWTEIKYCPFCGCRLEILEVA